MNYETTSSGWNTARALLKGLLLAVLLTSLGETTRAAIIANYNFGTNAVGSFGSADTEPNSTAAPISKGTGLNASSAIVTGVNDGNPRPSFKFDKNDMGNSLDQNDYIQFVVTASAGYSLNLSGGILTFDLLGTSGKTANWAVRSSLDNFGTNIASGTITSSSWVNNAANLSGAAFNGLSTITFRIYGWDTDQIDFNIDNIILDGAVVPEPVNIALGTCAVFAIGFTCIRRFQKRARR